MKRFAAAQRASELAPHSLISRANLGLGYVMLNEPGKAMEIASRFDAGSFYQIYIEALICRDSPRGRPSRSGFDSDGVEVCG